MRCVVQRVSEASVTVGGEEVAQIGRGLLVLAGVERGDTEADAIYMAGKVLKLRIFEDENEKMNLSVRDVQGEILSVSQFTLLGDARGQNRPGFTQAEEPEKANALFDFFCERLREGAPVQTGRFRTHMEVRLCNDGPVTILLDSGKAF